jgi:hypothetical protein
LVLVGFGWFWLVLVGFGWFWLEAAFWGREVKMFSKRAGLVFLIVALLVLEVGAPPLGWAQTVLSPQAEWILQGRVYAGQVGDESHPLQGVTVSVYGAVNPYPDVGTFLGSTSTNDVGWFSLSVNDGDPYEFFHILETDLAGYNSVGATSVSGTIRTANWVEYIIPLDGKTLTGNKFWDVSSSDQSEIPLDAVPPDSHRLAAQLIERVRGTEIAPGWDQAHLGTMARLLYRPDVEGVAYYEFQVLVDSETTGFIIVSTAEHDFPIVHWNFAGNPPTYELDQKAQEAGKTVARYYKLDTLDYAAEDAQGELVANLGTLPFKVVGMDPGWLDQPVELTSVSWIPDQETQDDTTPPTGGELITSGPVSSSWQLEAWGSWDELKAGYTTSYQVLIENLRREAAQDWEIDNLAKQYGEGLVKGDVYTLALICDVTPTVTPSGTGVGYIQTELLTRTGLPPAYRITVLDSLPGQELPLDITIDCPGSDSETIKFFIVGYYTLHLPLVNQRAGGQMAKAIQGISDIQSTDATWGLFWAYNGFNEQTMYYQLPFYPPPTISSCSSGCGATAWAMLFGWADHQADNAPGIWNYWSPRWGIYRQNSGYGANERAPLYVTDGIKNMTWEIRDDIATWCAFGSAPTFPWDMDQAAYYLSGRSGTRVDTHYNVLGITESRLREYARNSIIYRKTPAIIGTGWLKHYPLAYGYQWWSRRVKHCFIWCWHTTEYSRQMWVNQGWGGAGNGWISASTWFAGEIYP